MNPIFIDSQQNYKPLRSLEGLLLVNLMNADPAILNRYMGQEEYCRFMHYHHKDTKEDF